MATINKAQKAKFLETVKQKYIIPANTQLKKGIKAGILPSDCMVLWSNNSTIEIIDNSKKI